MPTTKHLWVPRSGAPSYCVRCEAVRGSKEAEQPCPGPKKDEAK